MVLLPKNACELLVSEVARACPPTSSVRLKSSRACSAVVMTSSRSIAFSSICRGIEDEKENFAFLVGPRMAPIPSASKYWSFFATPKKFTLRSLPPSVNAGSLVSLVGEAGSENSGSLGSLVDEAGSDHTGDWLPIPRSLGLFISSRISCARWSRKDGVGLCILPPSCVKICGRKMPVTSFTSGWAGLRRRVWSNAV